MANDYSYQYLRLEGTKDALVVSFIVRELVTMEDLQEVGTELLMACVTASRIDMPLVLSFEGVEAISSALIGKVVLLNKKLRGAGLRLTGRRPGCYAASRPST